MNTKNSIHQFMAFLKAALLLSITLAFTACPNAVLEPPERETPSYTVSFNANGGSGNMNSITVQEGTIITLNDCPFNKSGMMFVAWNTNGDGHGTGYPNETSLIVTRDMTLYAQWAVPHTVTFNSNGGTGSSYTQIVPENIATILKENAFTKSGKVLAYWNTNSSGTGTSYDDQGSAIFTQDTVLYAIWKNPCTVTFASNGGSAVENQIVAEGNKAKEPAAPKKDGYRFMGWYSDSALTSQFSFNTAITANTTLYASWKKVFTITYNANGGTGEITQQTLLEGDEITLRGNTFTRTDYGFACWNTSSDGSGDRYDDRETLTPTDSMTLYAQWGMNCTVSFNKNNDDAEGSMEEISAPAGSSV
ncbi:MAG: InlB B-repeat-containing protein, partial [Treponema sp.]|nr:InlB B-repeat-containing protein [Treponema sp.]